MLNRKHISVIIAFIFLVVAGGFLAYKYSFKKTTSQIEINAPEKIDAESSAAENTDTDIKASENNISNPAQDKQIEKGTAKAPQNDTTGSSSAAVKKLISWGFQKTDGRKIDTIIIHSSYDAIGSDPYSVAGILAEYKQYGVSAHYLMDRKGNIYQLVLDKDIAYHAGVAKLPDGRTNVNEVSLGIEMMNTKNDKFTAAQYNSLNNFLATLKSKYKIKYVLGHNQVAPGRKDDPWNFDWNKIK